MTGNILIKGNLYTNSDMTPYCLSKDGVVIHVQGDAYFLQDINTIEMKPNDVFIEDIYNTIKPKDIIAFSAIF
jgi:hypothetical protein